MRRPWILVLMLFVFSGSVALSQQAKWTTDPHTKPPKTLVLYDAFNGPRIDPAKWVGTWGDDSDLREAVRELAPKSDGENHS